MGECTLCAVRWIMSPVVVEYVGLLADQTAAPRGCCANCARKSRFCRVVAILPDGQRITSKKYVGPFGRRLLSPSAADLLRYHLEINIPEGHEGVRFETEEVGPEEIDELIAKVRH